MTFASTLQAAQTAFLQGEREQALELYRRLLQEHQDQPAGVQAKFWNQVGILQCQGGDNEGGIESFQQGIALLADMPEEHEMAARLYFHLGITQRTLGRREEAIESLYASQELQPNQLGTTLTLGQLYFELGHRTHARLCFEKLTVLEPDNPSNWLTLGYIMTLDGNDQEAVTTLMEAGRLDPQSPDACFHLAESLRKLGRYEEALPHYQRMLPIAMDWPQAMLGYAKTLLPLGRLEEGWDAFEFRRICQFGTWERHLLKNWDGTPDKEKNVLIFGENGIGTDIMFASCLNEAIRDLGHCVVECDASLHRLFARSFPEATFVPQTLTTLGENGETEIEIGGRPVSEQLAIGSLARLYRKQATDFPVRPSYLLPDPQGVAFWQNRFTALGRLPKIGFLWQGGGTDESSERLALPLELVSRCVRNEKRATWICLQRGSAQRKFESMRYGLGNIHLFTEPFDYDLDKMASLLVSLDLLITPAGSVAHLAGALGTRTWLLLPRQAAWRWSLGTDRTPWHPSARIFRQEKGETWSAVFGRMAQALEAFFDRAIHEEEEPALLPFRREWPEEKRRAA